MSYFPSISVIMSVFNGELYLEKSIESILSQSCKDFEFIIIDDSSNDSTSQILEQYSHDNQVKIITNTNNIGLTKSLNIGLKTAKGKYIARQDADDISLENRLSIQKEFLDSNENIGGVGTSNHYINKKGDILSTVNRESSEITTRWRLLFGNPIMHSSIMFRKNLVISIGGYKEIFNRSQDYDLWSQLITTSDIVQLPDVLIKYRKHQNSVSYTSDSEQLNNSISISKSNIENLLGQSVNTDFIKILRLRLDRNPNKSELIATIDLLDKLAVRFVKKNKLNIRYANKIHKRTCLMIYKIIQKYHINKSVKSFILLQAFIIRLKFWKSIFQLN